jgi:hypothetical protein
MVEFYLGKDFNKLFCGCYWYSQHDFQVKHFEER